MNSMKISDIDIKYGSLVEVNNRLAMMSSFDNTDEFNSFLTHAKGKNTLLDIGCSYGVFGLAFSKLNSNNMSYCFDGSISTWLTLNQTIEINELKNIKCHRTLIGDVDGMVGVAHEAHQSLVNLNSSTLELMMRVDTFCDLFGVVPNCIKIDTEGCEYKVLLGALNTIITHKPTLFMEVHPRFLQLHRHTIYDVVGLFNKINYVALDLKGNKIDNYIKELEEEETDSHRTVWVPAQ